MALFSFLPIIFSLSITCLATATLDASKSHYVDFVSRSEAMSLREEVRDMFHHAYDSYMRYAFPLDELRPMSCSGENSLGNYTLTLVDALDSLALMGNHSEFSWAVKWIGQNLDFDKNKTVSVFETNIRVMGGLLAGHLLASDPSTGMAVEGYSDELLHLADDLGRRLLRAFDTPTGIPFGSVNLRHSVAPDETTITSTAGGGTLLLEFGVLSRLTGNPEFEEAAMAAMRGIWSRKSDLKLVGAHIDVFSGEWTQQDAGIGTSVDSFYEYLLKGYILLGCYECFHIFREAYHAAMDYLHHDPWYVEVQMYSGVIVWPIFNSLQAFWPGLQAMVGDLDKAGRTHRAFFNVWKKYGFTPEGFNLAASRVQGSQKSYPLRPELVESTYWLYKATRDPWYLSVGREMLASLQMTRCPCGFCHVVDVESHELEDHMESFFLSETLKYLFLLFDLGVDGDNLVENGPYEYVFSTEGHLLPMTPQISIPSDSCKYPGSFCAASDENVDSMPKGTFSKVNADAEPPPKVHDLAPSTEDNEDGEKDEIDESRGSCPRLTRLQEWGIRPPSQGVDPPAMLPSRGQPIQIVGHHELVAKVEQLIKQLNLKGIATNSIREGKGGVGLEESENIALDGEGKDVRLGLLEQVQFALKDFNVVQLGPAVVRNGGGGEGEAGEKNAL